MLRWGTQAEQSDLSQLLLASSLCIPAQVQLLGRVPKPSARPVSRVLQALGLTEELVIAEEPGLIITVPLGSDLIQTPSGHVYRIRWLHRPDGTVFVSEKYVALLLTFCGWLQLKHAILSAFLQLDARRRWLVAHRRVQRRELIRVRLI